MLGISVDSTASKAAWAKSLGGLSFDLLSDFYPHGKVSQDYGVFFEPAGFSERAIIVLDRDGKVAFAKKYDITEAPDVEESLAAPSQGSDDGARLVVRFRLWASGFGPVWLWAWIATVESRRGGSESPQSRTCPSSSRNTAAAASPTSRRSSASPSA